VRRAESGVSCQPKPSGGAIITVEDTGIGIPTTKLPQIFDDYYRTAEAVKHNKASTGLGLAIVRRWPWRAWWAYAWKAPRNWARCLPLIFPACWGEPRGLPLTPGDLIMAYVLIVDDDVDFAGAVAPCSRVAATRRPPRPTPRRPSIASASAALTR